MARKYALLCLALSALLADPVGAGDSLEQQTKDLLVGQQKYLAASGAAREALLPQLETLARIRAQHLQETLASAPAAVFHVALPTATWATLPSSVQTLVEQSVTREGTVDAAPQEAYPYQLRDRQGRRARLVPVGQIPALTAGASVRLEGLLFQDALYFRAGGLTVLPRSGTDREMPTVTIEQPPEGAAVAGTVSVLVRATDNTRVRDAALLRDGKLLARREENPATFTWDTRLEADGPHLLAAQATDPDMNTGSSAPRHVTVDNTPPRARLTAPEAGTILAANAALQAQADDAIGLSGVKFLVDGRVIATIVKAPYTVTWDTSGTPNGPHTLEARAVDRAGNTGASAPVLVKLLNTNRKAPRLLPVGDKSVPEGATLSFKVLASDPDGPAEPLTYTATHLPSWASFDEQRQEFTGTPDFSVATHDRPTRVYAGVGFKVCDPQPLCDETAITLTVINVNQPPVMDPIGNQTAFEGQVLAVRPVVSDPDGDALTCSTQNNPAWLVLEPAACVLSGAPKLTAAAHEVGGQLIPAISVQACDPLQECVSQTFSLRVVSINERPALELVGDQTVDEGRPLLLRLQAQDPDSPRLTLDATGLPEGALFRETGRGRAELAWTPRPDQAGVYPVTVTVDDGRQTDTETLTITVRETVRALTGTIKDEMGKPAGGVVVSYGRAGERQHEVRTDAQGRYLITDLAPGAYTLRPMFPMGNIPVGHAVHFDPLSRRATVADQDLGGMDFLWLQKED